MRAPVSATDQQSFGHLLREYRIAAGLTQEGLAERARTSVRGVCDLERGARKHPQRETLRRLAEALGLRATEWSALAEASGRANLADAMPRALAGLPAPLSSFVGRAQDVAELAALATSVRLLTLTGPGGIGKTRLAIEVARRVGSDVRDGVWYIELAPIVDDELLPHTVARSLGVGVGPGQAPLDALCTALSARTMLLVLDNCEHLLAACRALIQPLLEACPAVHVLATSRESLDTPGETCWLVPPLSLAIAGIDDDPGPATDQSEASALFSARARAANRSFRANAPAIAAIDEICRRLDGLPLAIELAAAWVSVLSLQEIAARLASGSGFEATPHGGAARAQTLSATVDWSLQLLSTDEASLFTQLCIFRGGFTLRAAEALAGTGTLNRLARLVSASLVTVEAGSNGGSRFRILEPLRQIGYSRLQERVDYDAIRGQHAQYFQVFAESVQDRLWGRRARNGAIPELEEDVDNLRAALRWLIDQRENERAARFGAALARFWEFSGREVEGRTWLDELLRLDEITQPTRTRLLVGAAALATIDNDLGAAGALVDASLQAARETGDDLAVAWALLLRELRWLGVSDAVPAERILTASAEGIVRSRAAGEAALEAAHLNIQAVVLVLEGRFSEGEGAAQSARRRALKAGITREVAFSRLILAIARYGRGDLASAEQQFEEAWHAWRAESEPSWELMAIAGRTLVAADRRDVISIHAQLTRLFDLWSGYGRRPRLAERILQAYGYAAGSMGQHREVAIVGGVLDTNGQSIDYLRRFGRSFAAALHAAQRAIGDDAYASAWAEGQSLSLEQACALASRDRRAAHVEVNSSGVLRSGRGIHGE